MEKVVSLSTAKRLKEAGIVLETELCWAKCSNIMSTEYGCGEMRLITCSPEINASVEHYPAPDIAELLEALLREIIVDYFPYHLCNLLIHKEKDGYLAGYEDIIFKHEELVEALTQCLLWVRKQEVNDD